MPLQSSNDRYSRCMSFFFRFIENVRRTESKAILIRPSGILQTWKCQLLPLARTLSSSFDFDSTSQSKEGLLHFSYPVGYVDRLNGLVTISSKSSHPELKSWRLSISEISNGSSFFKVASRPFIKSGLSSNGSDFNSSFLSNAFVNTSMRGWNVTKIQTKSSAERGQFWSDGRRSHMNHAHDHVGHDSQEKLSANGEKVLRWGLWTDIILTIGKGAAGYVSGSNAIIADAAHSASDIVLSGVALWTSKASSVPPDKEHPYGHGKIETMGALSISILLLLTGGGIAWSAIDTLQVMIPSVLAFQDTAQTTIGTAAQLEVHSHGNVHEHGVVGHKHVLDMEHMGVALFAAVVGIGAKEGLYWITKAAGERAGSALLTASAWHHRSDAISSIVALIGVGGAMIGIPLLDPAAALLVSGMIVKAGLQTGYQSMQELLDMGLPETVLAPIRETVLKVDGVEGIHQLRGRRMGSTVHVDVHIEVDPWLSLSAAHNIGEAVKQQVRAHHPNVTESFIHIDPADGRPTSQCPGEMELGTGAPRQHYVEHRHDDHINTDQHSFLHPEKENTCYHRHDHDQDKYSATHGECSNAELTTTDRIDSEKREGAPFHNMYSSLQQSEVERVVRHVLGTNFREAVKVKVVTCHFLHGKVVAEVGVSLDPNLSIRDAMKYASDIETCLLRTVRDLSAVRVQLNLSSR